MSVNHTIFLAEQKCFQDATELDDFIDSGNEFHRTGATSLKERSPCRLSLLLGTTSNCLSVERNARVTAWVVLWSDVVQAEVNEQNNLEFNPTVDRQPV